MSPTIQSLGIDKLSQVEQLSLVNDAIQGDSTMTSPIEIVERGRGPQLSTSRVTVLDLVPYFRRESPENEIARWFPTLSLDEIRVVREHYLAHQAEFDDLDCQAVAYRQLQIELHRDRFPESAKSSAERMERLKQRLELHREEKAGAGNPRGS